MPFVRLRKEFLPPGGWRMPTPHGWIECRSPEELAAQLASYRRANLIDVGDTEDAVEAYFCAQFPDQCHGMEMLQTAPRDAARAIPGGVQARATAWLAASYQRGAGANHVDPEATLRRERVCQACEAHRPHLALGCCGMSREDAERLQTVLRKGKESALGLCELHGMDAGTAAFLPLSVLPSPIGEMPAGGCWIKEETKV